MDIIVMEGEVCSICGQIVSVVGRVVSVSNLINLEISIKKNESKIPTHMT